MSVLRVLHVINSLGIGGAETTLTQLIKTWDRRVVSSSVLSLTTLGPLGRELMSLGVPVTTLELGLKTSLAKGGIELVRQKLGRAVEADVVQGWMYHGNVAALLVWAVSRARPRLAYNIRSDFTGYAHEPPRLARVMRLNALTSAIPDAIVCNSTLAIDNHRAAGYGRGRWRWIPNGFDVDRFAPSHEARASVRAELGVSDDTRLIGLIGRFHPAKGHDVFLEAAVAVAERIQGVHFVLAGTSVSYDTPELSRLVGDKLRPRVHLLGERQDAPRITTALDVAVSASRTEAFSNTLGEALASGVLCVATDVGDSKQIVGQAGLLVPPGEPGELAAALVQLLSLAPEARVALGAAGRARVSENYSLNSVADRYASMYEGLMSRAGDASTDRTG